MALSKELLDILACPLCKTPVRLEGTLLLCENTECACHYRVEDGIPNMLIEEAERPCPRCATRREWLPDKDTIRCPKCGAKFTHG